MKFFSHLLHKTFSSPSSHSTLNLLKTSQNPETILSILKSVSLSGSSRSSRISLSVAISKLPKNHIKSFLEETKEKNKTNEFFLRSIVLYGYAGLVDDAVRTFEEMHELGLRQNVESFNALLFSCRVAKRYDEVKRVFVEFPKRYNLELDLDSYNSVIKSFCESGSPSAVYSVLAEMDRKKIRPDSTSIGLLVSGFYKEEQYEEVGKVLDLMKKYNMIPDVGMYNIRIQSLCKLKKSNEAKVLMDGMVSRGIKPNSVTFHHLIHGFCKEGKLEEAKGLFKKMVNYGVYPDSDCYFSMVYFLCEAGDFESALVVCKESMEKGWIPYFTCMKKLVNGLISVGKVEDAKELLGKMKKKFPNRAHMWNEVEEGLPK